MNRILIYYKPENIDVAVNLRDNYLAHGHKEIDIVSVKEQDDIKYAQKMQYDEAIFIEDSDTVIIHDIKTCFTERLHVSGALYKD